MTAYSRLYYFLPPTYNGNIANGLDLSSGRSEKGDVVGLRLCQFSLHPGACAIWAASAFLVISPSVSASTISGEAKFLGPVPNSHPIRVSKDQDYCGQTLPNEGTLIGPGQGLKNVVVYLEKAPEAPAPFPRDKENLLDNNGCRMTPRVMAIRLGERLVIKNSDPKLHILHSYLEKRTVFNLSLPFQGTKMDITHKIKGPGLLQINCDTHAWMRGYLYVFDHPFFAVTDERGFFSIGDIPPGKYTLKAWHEEAGIQSREVVVPEDREIQIHWEFGK